MTILFFVGMTRTCDLLACRDQFLKMFVGKHLEFFSLSGSLYLPPRLQKLVLGRYYMMINFHCVFLSCMSTWNINGDIIMPLFSNRVTQQLVQWNIGYLIYYRCMNSLPRNHITCMFQLAMNEPGS